ncbi:helix-turn-helix domain-containing protein [Yinghuangia seranimata]|uniref:helix-turn-helix domain-containing protein n=1 Tax=Yinghuangia seranimata TaxID=408067 RepID=UPI00248B984F|nr:helix-turn-helix domain-containing protein [Yinghuangia seranimata]MDI2131510.1 helix-turn-helix domain-containing protein [Yinghuangia seranimata]
MAERQDTADTGTDFATAVWLTALARERADLDDRVRRLHAAETALRESVVELVMSGRLEPARRIAALAGGGLPDPVRAFVVQARAGERDRAADACVRVGAETGTEVWVRRCPDHALHVLVLAPGDAVGYAAAVRAAMGGRCRIAASLALPLQDVVFAYGQALAGLMAPGRRASDGPAVPSPGNGFAPLTGELGRQWAAGFLAPIRAHEPARPQDPLPDDLMTTARMWLVFGREAAARLYLHRNTVASRLRLVGRLLRLDLATVGSQATLCLALALDELPRPRPLDTPRRVDFGAVLTQPLARGWARAVLRDVLDEPDSTDAVTLRVWLDYDCQARAAAYVLGISGPGLRKRLARLSERLRTDGLGNPVVQRDLWLATRVLDAAARR